MINIQDLLTKCQLFIQNSQEGNYKYCIQRLGSLLFHIWKQIENRILGINTSSCSDSVPYQNFESAIWKKYLTYGHNA